MKEKSSEKLATVASSGNAGRNTSLIAKNSGKRTIGSQESWRHNPRNRIPWENNLVFANQDIAHIGVYREGRADEERIVTVDTEDMHKLKYPLRIQNEYAMECGVNSSVAHKILGIRPDPELKIVVDHINGDHLDNRKSNLRILQFRDNVRNKGHYSLNHTGIIGLSKGKFKCKGCDILYDRYVATLTDPRFPIDPKTGKGKRYTRAVSYGVHRTEEEARAIALDWLRKKQEEVGYHQFKEIKVQRLSPAGE